MSSAAYAIARVTDPCGAHSSHRGWRGMLIGALVGVAVIVAAPVLIGVGVVGAGLLGAAVVGLGAVSMVTGAAALGAKIGKLIRTESGAPCSSITVGSSKTKAEGLAVARIGDQNTHNRATVRSGAEKVLEGGKPVARVGEASTCGSGKILRGAQKTIVGGPSVDSGAPSTDGEDALFERVLGALDTISTWTGIAQIPLMAVGAFRTGASMAVSRMAVPAAERAGARAAIASGGRAAAGGAATGAARAAGAGGARAAAADAARAASGRASAAMTALRTSPKARAIAGGTTEVAKMAVPVSAQIAAQSYGSEYVSAGIQWGTGMTKEQADVATEALFMVGPMAAGPIRAPARETGRLVAGKDGVYTPEMARPSMREQWGGEAANFRQGVSDARQGNYRESLFGRPDGSAPTPRAEPVRNEVDGGTLHQGPDGVYRPAEPVVADAPRLPAPEPRLPAPAPRPVGEPPRSPDDVFHMDAAGADIPAGNVPLDVGNQVPAFNHSPTERAYELPRTSYPREVDGVRVNPDPAYVGDRGYGTVTSNGHEVPYRVLGRDEAGNLRIEAAMPDGTLRRTALNPEQEARFVAGRTGGEASRTGFLRAEANNLPPLGRLGTENIHSRMREERGEGGRPIYETAVRLPDGSVHTIYSMAGDGVSVEGMRAFHEAMPRIHNALSALPPDLVRQVDRIRGFGTDRASDPALAYGGVDSSGRGIVTLSDRLLGENRNYFENPRYNEVPQAHSDPLVDVLAHEFGHVAARKAPGSVDAVPNGWEAVVGHDNRAVSSYGRTNYAEDFAESMRAYVATEGGRLDPSALQKFEHRFRFIREMMTPNTSSRGTTHGAGDAVQGTNGAAGHGHGQAPCATCGPPAGPAPGAVPMNPMVPSGTGSRGGSQSVWTQGAEAQGVGRGPGMDPMRPAPKQELSLEPMEPRAPRQELSLEPMEPRAPRQELSLEPMEPRAPREELSLTPKEPTFDFGALSLEPIDASPRAAPVFFEAARQTTAPGEFGTFRTMGDGGPDLSRARGITEQNFAERYGEGLSPKDVADTNRALAAVRERLAQIDAANPGARDGALTGDAVRYDCNIRNKEVFDVLRQQGIEAHFVRDSSTHVADHHFVVFRAGDSDRHFVLDAAADQYEPMINRSSDVGLVAMPFGQGVRVNDNGMLAVAGGSHDHTAVRVLGEGDSPYGRVAGNESTVLAKESTLPRSLSDADF